MNESSQSGADSNHAKKDRMGGIDLPLKTRIKIWLLALANPNRIRMRDVRRFVCWLCQLRTLSFRETLVSWELANGLVWMLAFGFQRKTGRPAPQTAHSLYRAAAIVRDGADAVTDFHLFTDIITPKSETFANRDWTFFDAHGGRLFAPPTVRLVTTFAQISEFDLSVYEAGGRFCASIRDQVFSEAQHARFYDAVGRFYRALMGLRGHRRIFLGTFATYLDELARYSVEISDGRARDPLLHAAAAIRHVAALEPGEKNAMTIRAGIRLALAAANTGGERVYAARLKAALVGRDRSLPGPSRSAVAREIVPGVDPQDLKSLLRDVYERGVKAGEAEGFKAGIAAAFSQINLKGAFAEFAKSTKAELASSVESAVRKGIDTSLVAEISAAGQKGVNKRSAAQQLKISRPTLDRWIAFCETNGKEGNACPVPGFSPILLKSQTAFEKWKPVYLSYKAAGGAKGRKRRPPKTAAAAEKQDHEDIEEMFTSYSHGV